MRDIEFSCERCGFGTTRLHSFNIAGKMVCNNCYMEATTQVRATSAGIPSYEEVRMLRQ